MKRRAAERALAPALLVALLTACVQLDRRRSDELRAAEHAIAARLDTPFRASWPGPIDAPPSDEAVALFEDGLDVDEAVSLALLENRDVRAAFERLGVASYERVRAGLVSNPLLSAALRFHSAETELDLGLSQPLVDLFQRSMRVDVAEAELVEARAAVQAELVRVADSVRRAVLAEIAERERVGVRRAFAEVAGQAEELMKALHAAGNVTDLELSLERRARVEAALELATAEARLVERREELIAMLGLPADPGFELHGELPRVGEPQSPDDVAALAVRENLALAQSAARLERLAARAGLPAAARVLDAAAVGADAEKEGEGDHWGIGPTVSLPVPLFDTGRAARAAAQAEWRAALLAHESDIRGMRSLARRIARRHAALIERATIVDAELRPLAAQAVVETLQQYNAMQIGAFDVLEERRAELATELTAIELWHEAAGARLDLDTLLLGVAPDAGGPDRERDHHTSPDKPRERRDHP